jgi:DNA-binding HxlR family transcriptional regulator
VLIGASGTELNVELVMPLLIGVPVEIQHDPSPWSAGVLDRHLQQMVTLGLLLRRRFKEMPPRVEISLTEAGRELLPIADALARWGVKHM